MGVAGVDLRRLIDGSVVKLAHPQPVFTLDHGSGVDAGAAVEFWCGSAVTQCVKITHLAQVESGVLADPKARSIRCDDTLCLLQQTVAHLFVKLNDFKMQRVVVFVHRLVQRSRHVLCQKHVDLHLGPMNRLADFYASALEVFKRFVAVRLLFTDHRLLGPLRYTHQESVETSPEMPTDFRHRKLLIGVSVHVPNGDS